MSRQIKIFLCCFMVAASVFSQNNSSLDNKYRLGKLYEQNGDLEKAKQIYLELNQIQPWNQTYLVDLNNVYLAQKDYNSSIELLQKRLQTNPKDLSSYGLLGSTYFIMGETEKAYQIWDEAIQSNNNISPNVYRVMANYPIENRAFDKAIEYLKKGQSISKDPLVFSYDLAGLYTAVMNYRDATEEYCKILSVQSQQLDIVKSRLLTYFDRADASEIIISVIQKHFNLTKSSEFANLLSYFLLITKKYDEALNVILSFEQKVNSNGQQILSFANQCLAENAFETSKKAFEFALAKNNPAIVPACKIGIAKSSEMEQNKKYFNEFNDWYNLSEFDTTGKRYYDDVIKLYEEISKLYPNSEEANEANYKIGNIYLYKFFDVNSAMGKFSFISSKFPFSKYALDSIIKLTYCKLLTGNYSLLKEDVEKISMYPRITSDKIALAKYYLALSEFWQGNFSNSQNLLSEIIKQLDDNTANDALELSLLINFNKSDSLNLAKYAKADYFFFLRNFTEAKNKFLNLSSNENLIILSKEAKYKLAEISLAQGDATTALAYLKELSDEELSFLNDKCAFLQGSIYYFIVKDFNLARTAMNSLLEKFPNSLYVEKARELLNRIEYKNKE